MVSASRQRFGEYLAERRLRAGYYTQLSFAEALNAVAATTTLTGHEVSRWERGVRLPDGWLPTIADVLGVTADELSDAARASRKGQPHRLIAEYEPAGGMDRSAVAAGPQTSDDASMRRRELLGAAGAAALAYTGRSLARGSAIFDAPEDILTRMRTLSVGGIDEALLDHLERTTAAAIAASERLTPQELAPDLRTIRAQVDQALNARQQPSRLTRLYRVGSRLSGLLATTALDMGNAAVARACAGEAYQLGAYLADMELAAWARATQALVEYYSGNYPESLRYSQHGQEIDSTGPHLARLLVNGTARALAGMGDQRGVSAAISWATAITPPDESPAGRCPSLALTPYCSTRVAANAATARLAIGDVQLARRHVEDALPVIDNAGLSGPRALTRIDLATATLAEDPRAACHLVHEALTITDRMSVLTRADAFLAAGRGVISRADTDAITQHLNRVRPLDTRSPSTGSQP